MNCNKLLTFLIHSFFLALLLLTVKEITLADQFPAPPPSCKIKREKLEENIEKYRRRETPFVDDKSYFMFCRSARPVLAKYNLDADPMIRNTIAGFLNYTYSEFNMRLLAAQVETYPLKYSFAVRHLSNYKCKDLLKLKAKRIESLRNALITEARNDPDFLANGAGTLLRCFAEKDEQARQFLAERSKP
jgi:hypothetical protein